MQDKLTIEEVAQKLKVSKRTILREIKRGKLTTERIGRKHLISETTLQKYLKKDSSDINDALERFSLEKRSEMVSLLQRLVSMPSVTSEPDKELELARFIKRLLDKWGIRNVLYHEGEKVAVRASYGYAKDGILLDCPLDTVSSGDEAKWHHPPFEGVISEGKMYGRGTADCKGGIVAMLYTLLFCKKNISEDQVRIETVFDGGEQDGVFAGMKLVLSKGLPVTTGIVGYAGDMKDLQIGARGYHRYKVTANGESVHTGSRFKPGINAISHMARFIVALESLKLTASKDSLFSFGSRLTVSQIEGGKAINIVPDKCSAKLDFRTTPNIKKEDVDNEIKRTISELKKQIANLSIETEYLVGHEAYLSSSENKFFDALKKGIHEITGEKVTLSVSGPAHVGNLLSEHDISVAVWGPKGENAHSYNEYIEIDSLPVAMKTYVKAITNYFLSQ